VSSLTTNQNRQQQEVKPQQQQVTTTTTTTTQQLKESSDRSRNKSRNLFTIDTITNKAFSPFVTRKKSLNYQDQYFVSGSIAEKLKNCY